MYVPEHFGFVEKDTFLRSMMRHCAKLVRASLMLVAIGGAATAGPLADAVVAYQRGDYATALRLWHPLAEQGDTDAQFHLGVMFESGQGVLRNDAEAIKWYRKAAEQDDAVAQFNLGVMYAKGMSPNHAEAALWYRLAADHGLAGAQFNLESTEGWINRFTAGFTCPAATRRRQQEPEWPGPRRALES